MEFVDSMLLVAAPLLADPNFQRTVVLVTEHTDDGAMGVVLNRPSETTVADALPDLADVCDPGESIYVGGPVQAEAVVVLAEFDDPSAAAGLVTADIGFASASADLGQIARATRRARAFVGYAGWGPGQLEYELDREDWILHPAEREQIFTDDPARLWRSVLERKGGEYALLARMPLDPSLN